MPVKKRINSRLARKESKRMLQQTGLLVVATLALLGTVVYFGIPLLVKFAGFLGDVKNASEPIENTDTIAPFVPQLVVPFEATSSAKIRITGFAEAGATVYLFNSGNKVGEIITQDDGAFEFADIQLRSGANEFSAQAVDNSGNESAPTKIYEVTQDNEGPELTVDQPANGSEFFGASEKVVTIKGKTDPGAKVYVNTRVAFVDSQGNFKVSLSLQNGDNKLTVRSVDKAGNETTSELNLKFRE